MSLLTNALAAITSFTTLTSRFVFHIKPLHHIKNVTIAANGNYDLNARLIGGVAFNGAALWDYTTCNISVTTIDTDAGSPTLNYRINALALVSVGVKSDGTMRFNNTTSNSISVDILVGAPTRKL